VGTERATTINQWKKLATTMACNKDGQNKKKHIKSINLWTPACLLWCSGSYQTVTAEKVGTGRKMSTWQLATINQLSVAAHIGALSK